MNFTQEEYQKKRLEIINNFTQGFIDKKYNYCPLTMVIIERLIMDENPYNIIEKLIINQDDLIKKINNSTMTSTLLKTEDLI